VKWKGNERKREDAGKKADEAKGTNMKRLVG